MFNQLSDCVFANSPDFVKVDTNREVFFAIPLREFKFEKAGICLLKTAEDNVGGQDVCLTPLFLVHRVILEAFDSGVD